ncbi:MAG TPA: inositol monophosphatase [Candidatus Saccharibacteria bacterium]|jgi:myo-inositol-1(or 4)-monophosphatase|nr:inositol monophosphatase [Candidatus Saccharibacteria bacterium]
MDEYLRELQIAKRLANDAGAIMRKYFSSGEDGARVKDDKTIVTKADTEINLHVIAVLATETPDYSVWGEEEKSIKQDAPYTWVCDPVDGTMPFAKGLPISTFSIALVNAEGMSVLGVVYDPFTDKLYEAVRGKGAFMNGTPIRVSDKDTFDGAYIDEELWFNSEEQVAFDSPKGALNKQGAKVTTLCSAVITGCMVANGTYDSMLFGQGKPEDIAALSVIVTEAGGKVTDLFGNEQRYDTNIRGAVVSNGHLHEKLVQLTSKMNYTSKYL